jgi:multidrug efflux system membrane fusion protein
MDNDLSMSPSLSTPRARPGSRRARNLLVAVLALLALLAAFRVLAKGKARSAAAAAQASASARRVTAVGTAEVVQRDLPVWREGLGTVAAFNTVTVKSQVDGRIDRVLFREGQQVQKGTLLVQIDPRPFRIQLETAQANLARDTANRKNAQVNAERYQTLSEQHLIAPQQYTDQQATVAELDAQIRADSAAIDAARLNLDFARITSPIDGVAGVRLVDPGNVVHASDATGLVVVTELDPIAVFFSLPEDDLADINRAMASSALTVEARSRDGDTLLATGKLTVIDNQINQQTATLRLKATFDNPKHLLWPNQFVKARLKLATRVGAIVVPAAAIQRGPQGSFVYVVRPDSVAVSRPVVVSATQGDVAVIESGLSAGETVVVDGQAQLRPFAHVSARPVASDSSTPNGGKP